MGGIGTYVANMTQVLAEAGHRVSVLTQYHPAAPAQGFETPHLSLDGRLRVYYLPFVDEKWQLRPEARNALVEALMRRDSAAGFGPIVSSALERLLIHEHIDAIEAPEYEAPLLHFQQMRAALPPAHPWRKVPTIVHLHSPSHLIFEHDDDPTCTQWLRARKADEAQSIWMADGVLCPSAFLAAQVREWLRLSEDSVRVIPYLIGPLLEYEQDSTPQPGLCLFVGRVEPRKGVFEFVEAAVDAAREFPSARFRFVGGPHLRSGIKGEETARLLESLIPAELRARFAFAGRVPREALGREYRSASFVAVPSRWDNYPNTCMEAMSCARPVLASDQGGMAEMLAGPKQGCLVQGQDRGTLARNLRDGLRQMLTKGADELAQMGQRARERILEICADATILRLHEEYYKGMALRCAASIPDPARPKAGVLLADDGAAPERIPRATLAIDAQTLEPSAKLFIAEGTCSVPAGWSCVNARALVTEHAPSMPDVIYIGAADDILPSDALERAANAFATFPELGYCTPLLRWNGLLTCPFRSDALQLISPSEQPLRGFFRKEALIDCGGVFVNGHYLPDLLRDAMLRLLAKGWRGCSLAGAAVEGLHRESRPLLRPLAYHERRDSQLAIARAHIAQASADPASLAELLASIRA